MKVLVVDDNPINRLLPVAWLTREGHEADQSVDGYGVVEKVEAGHFDAVLLDLSMPGLSGMEVCRLLRATPAGKALRIIAYTAHAAPNAAAELKAMGFDDLLVKPINRDRLVAALQLDQSQA